jgi:hypothetical protein
MNRAVVWISLLGVIAATFAGCIQSEENEKVDEKGYMNHGVIKEEILQIPAKKLSEVEKEGIHYIREEERLARDVYQTLFEKWVYRFSAI